MSEEGDFEIVETKENAPIVNVQKIRGSERIYADTISLTEFVQVVFTRADQISSGAKIYVESQTAFAHELAIKEIIQGQCPLSIIRHRGNVNGIDYVEVWDVNELKISMKCISDAESIFDKGGKMDIVKKIENLTNM